jgi:hypothetical protein
MTKVNTMKMSCLRKKCSKEEPEPYTGKGTRIAKSQIDRKGMTDAYMDSISGFVLLITFYKLKKDQAGC